MAEFTRRQEEIINAVIDLIAEKGLREFSMRTLAKKVGVSEPALYRHFENKDDVHLMVIGYIGQHWQRFIKGLRWPQQTALGELESMCQFVIEKMEEIWPMTATLYSSAVISNPQLLQEIFKTIEYATEHVESIIRRGQKEQAIRRDVSGKVLAALFVGTLRNTIEQWNLNGQKANLLQEWRLMWDGMKVMFQPATES